MPRTHKILGLVAGVVFAIGEPSTAAPPNKPALNPFEKKQVHDIRRNLIALRKKVESSFYCPACHDSKIKIIDVPAKRPKGLPEQKEISCPKCGGRGILIAPAFFTALSEYYQGFSSATDREKPWIEDPLTLGRWVINHATEPWILDELSSRSASFSTRIMAVRLIDFYRSREHRWAVALGQIVGSDGDNGPPAMLIFPTGMYPFSNEQAMSGYARLIAVAYREPDVKRWQDSSSSALLAEQARYPNLAAAPAIDRAWIESLQRIVTWLSAAGNVMTIVDCVMEPTRFHPQTVAVPATNARQRRAGGGNATK